MLSSSNLIYSIIDNSFEIYDGLVKKTIDIDKIYNLLKNKKELKKKDIIKITDIKKNRMLNNYKKSNYLDQILALDQDRFKYLIDVRYLINLDDLIEYILPNEIYIEKVKLEYSNKIIDLLLDKYYDNDSVRLLGKTKQSIYLLDKRLNNKIIKRIKQYYVKKITV